MAIALAQAGLTICVAVGLGEAIVGRFADMEGVIRAAWRLGPQGS